MKFPFFNTIKYLKASSNFNTLSNRRFLGTEINDLRKLDQNQTMKIVLNLGLIFLNEFLNWRFFKTTEVIKLKPSQAGFLLENRLPNIKGNVQGKRNSKM